MGKIRSCRKCNEYFPNYGKENLCVYVYKANVAMVGECMYGDIKPPEPCETCKQKYPCSKDTKQAEICKKDQYKNYTSSSNPNYPN